MSGQANPEALVPPLPRSGAVLAVASVAALALVALLHIGIGANWVSPATAIEAIFAYDSANFDHQIIVSLRVPRLVVALAVGASLGLAGATLQALTRNPLAGPGILGMNAGAALVVVVATAIGGAAPVGVALPWLAALGAVGVFAIVFALASAGRSGPTPVKVTLAGVAMAAFASSITSAILIFDEQTLQAIRLWLAGNLAGRSLEGLGYALPPMVVGGLIALAMSLRLNAMALGEQAATSLGVRVFHARIACLVAVALLAGAAVAAAGPIGFIGLVVPHVVKLFAPNENRLILPLSAVVGALVLIVADIVARVALSPQEIATGLVTALVGAPIFIVLVRSRL